MKKVLFLLAVGAMFSFAACKSQPKEEPQQEEVTPVEQTVVEQAPEATTDTTAVAPEAAPATPEKN